MEKGWRCWSGRAGRGSRVVERPGIGIGVRGEDEGVGIEGAIRVLPERGGVGHVVGGVVDVRHGHC